MRRLLQLFSFFVLFCGLALPALAAAPRFSNILPRGVQRGTEVEFKLYGSNLEDAEELMLYDSGMEVVSFAAHEDEKQKGRLWIAKLKVKEDCPLGKQRMRIRTRTGLSDLQIVQVGALPIVEEKEPNTDFESPQEIEMNVAVQGRVDSEDVDYYVVNAKAGDRITAEIVGQRLGYSTGTNFFDPFVAILDEARFELAVSDDDPLVRNDCVVSVIAPKDGRYYVSVRDSSYNGDGRAYYLANIGTFPRPKAVIPAGGKPGETLTVTYLGDVKGPFTREVTLPQSGDAEFGLEVQDDYGVAASNQPFRISNLDNFVEVEPNNDRNTATPAAAPGAYNGVISEEKDFDFFKFSAKKDQQFEVEVYARRIRSGLDPVVYVYEAATGKQVVANDDSRGPDSYIRFKAPADGEYVAAVRDHLWNGDPTYTYRIELTPVSPSLEATPIEFARYQQQLIEIPQGAGSGIVATVKRENIGGPVNFISENLPAGVRIECPEGWRGGGTMPIVFYANEDAPIGGTHAEVKTVLADPNQKDKVVEGPLYQDILMIRGRNNDRVIEERITRLPIIVTEKAPFKVWVEEPKAPIVRGGSMNLIVKCERQEGWDEEIAVRLLQNPSGVNSSTSTKFKKGETQVNLSMNAAGNAAIGETLISLRCTAKVGNGNIELCTPFVPMRVAEQYMTLEFAQGAVEIGKEVVYPVKVNQATAFEGEAEIKLVGLPANATAEPLKVTKETEELLFTIKTAENTPAGMSKNIFCQALVPENGTTIVHNLGTGRLRVDKPLPPKKDAPPKPTPKPAEVAKKEPPKKPLSRLEMLRLQKQQEAAAGSEE